MPEFFYLTKRRPFLKKFSGYSCVVCRPERDDNRFQGLSQEVRLVAFLGRKKSRGELLAKSSTRRASQPRARFEKRHTFSPSFSSILLSSTCPNVKRFFSYINTKV